MTGKYPLGVYQDPAGPEDVHWVRSHHLYRRHKVILNVYHIFPTWLNKTLSALGLGGGYHSAIQYKGIEFCFGAHFDSLKGICDMEPLWKIRANLEAEMQRVERDGTSDATTSGRLWDAAIPFTGIRPSRGGRERESPEALRRRLEEMVASVPALKERHVLGWWAGGDQDWDELLDLVKSEWRGPDYRLISKNCNHFVTFMYGIMLQHPDFKPMPKKYFDAQKVLGRIDRLTKKARGCCFPRSWLDVGPGPWPYIPILYKGASRIPGEDYMPSQQRAKVKAPAAPAAQEDPELRERMRDTVRQSWQARESVLRGQGRVLHLLRRAQGRAAPHAPPNGPDRPVGRGQLLVPPDSPTPPPRLVLPPKPRVTGDSIAGGSDDSDRVGGSEVPERSYSQFDPKAPGGRAQGRGASAVLAGVLLSSASGGSGPLGAEYGPGPSAAPGGSGKGHEGRGATRPGTPTGNPISVSDVRVEV